MVTAGYVRSSDPNDGHLVWMSIGATAVTMWPWQSVTQREDSETDGLTPVIGKINCTTGVGHEHDDRDLKMVDIHY